MDLKKLISNLKVEQIVNEINFDVGGIAFDSRYIKNNFIFICLQGAVDGVDFVDEAVSNGAKCIVVNQIINDIDVMQIVVTNTRIALSCLCAMFYNNPSDKLKFIMVTGTNGKTSVSYILQSIFKCAGIKVAIIGTNGIFVDDKRLYYGLTTPDPTDLHYYLSQLVELNVEVVVMEASAHAIYLHKLYGIKAEQIIYTNLTEEHLDYFDNMQKYSAVKTDFINCKNTSVAIVNSDCKYSKNINTANLNVVNYGLNNPAEAFAVNICFTINGTSAVVNVLDNIINIDTGLVGLFNVYNILAAVSSAYLYGIDACVIETAICEIKHIEGRMMRYTLDCNNLVIIDFAHTTDGFEQVFSEVARLRNGKFICVFGCVGYSDFNKRVEFGKIASKYCSQIVLTSDNPNYQNIESICADIANGVTVDYVVIEDRASAIEFALSKMDLNQTLLILGKGCEEHNLINGVKMFCNDEKSLFAAIEKLYGFKKGGNVG